MITPIDKDLVFWVSAIFAAIGFAAGVYIFLFSTWAPRGIRMTIGLFLGMPMLAGAWGYGTVWRIAEHLAFDASGSAWESAKYPITSINWPNRRGPGERATLSIDPFDAGKTRIPIPDYQYMMLDGEYEGRCVRVEQRRNGDGAIQIRTNGTYTSSDPVPVEITSC